MHAQAEEEIYYPAAILVGEYLKAKNSSLLFPIYISYHSLWENRQLFKRKSISTAAIIWASVSSKLFCFAPFTQTLVVRLSNLTHKRGRRSARSQEIRSQCQTARQFVQGQAFFDRIRGESICRSTIEDVTNHLASLFEQPIPEALPMVEPGLVLANLRGEGAFQLLTHNL
jgi:hypothetical protein